MTLGEELDFELKDLRERIEELEPSEGAMRSYESKVEAFRARIERLEGLVITHMSESVQQWVDARLTALEHQVKGLRKLSERDATLMAEAILNPPEPNEKLKELFDGEGPKADRKRYAENLVQRDAIPLDIDVAFKSHLRSLRLDRGEGGPGDEPGAAD